MTEPSMTKEQEELLAEAAKYARLFEQQAQELSRRGNALATQVECLLQEQEVPLSNAID
jgi:hypothetical protein